MLKVYGIAGITSANLTIKTRSGRSFIKCEFKHGRMGIGTGNKPATYSTADPVEQAIIEDSPMFAEHRIKLIRGSENGKALTAFEIRRIEAENIRTAVAARAKRSAPAKQSASAAAAPAPVAEPAPSPSVVELAESESEPEPAPAAEPQVQVHEEITAKEEAVALLKSLGAKAIELTTPERILKCAVKHNVSFPNIVF